MSLIDGWEEFCDGQFGETTWLFVSIRDGAAHDPAGSTCSATDDMVSLYDRLARLVDGNDIIDPRLVERCSQSVRTIRKGDRIAAG